MQFQQNLNRLLQRHSAEELASAAGLSPDRLTNLLAGDAPSLEETVALAHGTGNSLDRLVLGQLPGEPKRKVRLLVLDVDGVLTEGGMFVMESGDEMKKFHTRDGRGIIELQKRGTEVAILSGSLNGQAIYKRAERLGVKRVFAGRKEKTILLEGWMAELGIGYGDVAYVGDDLNDLKVIEQVGFSACPADAVELVKTRVDVVLQTRGGQGCVREFIEDYLA